MHNYKELKVWQKGRTLVKDIYLASQNFPSEEKFGLRSQLRRCAVSIPSNIAEGSGRGTNKDFAHFLNIALSSAYELETEIILSYDLSFISEEIHNELTEKAQEIQKMVIGFQRSL